MNTSWQDFLASHGARFDSGLVSSFGDAQVELVAARESTVVAPLLHLGLLEWAGDDAQGFLQNQLTSDINQIKSGTAQHSAWCSAKGRMQASFILFGRERLISGLISHDLAESVRTGLQKYVLRSKVSLSERSADFAAIGLSGPESGLALKEAGLSDPAQTMQTADFPAGTLIRLDDSRRVVVVAADEAAGLWKKLSIHARPVNTQAWHWLDIQAGIPLITAATREAFVPQMANFDRIGGVSFRKGCYPGQEVVARTQYLGKVKRHLYRIHSDHALSAGTALYTPENPATVSGTVANAAPAPNGGFDALAVVQESFAGSERLCYDLAGQTGIAITSITPVGD